MESKYKLYNYTDSFDRIDDIIKGDDVSYEESDSIPSRDKLTFTNGFYVYCTALAVDIRDSSGLPSKHRTPKLAKLYRSYVSEIVAILNSDIRCAEISIIGDGVVGIFNSTLKNDILMILGTSAQISSLIDVMNYKFNKNSISEIKIGIGVSYSRALMIKAGNKGSAINDVVWLGNVVNEAVHLSAYGNKTYNDRETMISSTIYNNLEDEYKKLFTYNYTRGCYNGDIYNKDMNDWYNENCTN